ncbi:MAG: hypothetical protein ACRDL1_02920 [Solirubrobacterales bacterium]
MAVIATAVAASAVSMWLSVFPGTAGAAIQLGQVSPVNPSACDVQSYVQHDLGASPSVPYTVPSPGVITRWSHRGIFVKQPDLPDKTPPAGSGRLQVWDPDLIHVPVPATNFVVLRGRSGVETFTPSVETTYLTRIPVSAGDWLGMRSEARTGCLHQGTSDDRQFFLGGSDPAPGDPKVITGGNKGILLNLSAVLEPDADADGFGDETQDECPTDTTTQGPCGGGGGGGGGGGSPGFGTPSNEFSFGKVKKNKRKGTAKLTVEVPGPGDLALTETDKVKGTEKEADAAGDEKLAIKPQGKAKRKLNRKGKGKVEAEVTYTPELGASNTDSKNVNLKKR